MLLCQVSQNITQIPPNKLQHMKAARRLSQAFDKAIVNFNKRHTTAFVTDTPLQTPTDEDFFKFSVLLNPEKHDQLLRFAFTEYNENAMFFYDAIQDMKEVIDNQLLLLAFMSAYDEYLDEISSKRVKIDPSTYERVNECLEFARYDENYDIRVILPLLEDQTVKILMKVYDRFLSPPDESSPVKQRASMRLAPTTVVPWTGYEEKTEVKKFKFSFKKLFRSFSK
jgi:hypothetical protein